jgi:hypothetical protein
VIAQPSSDRRPKKRIGLVELPDSAVDLLIRLSQKPAWQVAVVVSRNANSEAARVAGRLGIPVIDVPHRTALASCDRVIVASQNIYLFVSIKEMLRDSPVEVLRQSQFNEALAREERERRTAWQDRMRDEQQFADGTPRGEPLRVVEHLSAIESAAPAAPEAVETPAPGAEPEAVAAPEAVETPAPGAEPEAVAAEPPPASAPLPALAPTPASAPARASLFHARTLLGGDLSPVEAVGVDIENDDLNEILECAREATQARTSSLMLVDADGQHLCIAAARGLPRDLIERVRQRIGEGTAGTVFASHNAMTERGQFPSLAEEDGRPVYRIAASVPVLIAGRAIGVLSINAESRENLLDKKVLNPLARLARRLPGVILSAIDLGPLPAERRRQALQRQIDALMVLDRALPDRLGAVSEAVRRALGAEAAQFLLVDRHRRRFHSSSPALGLASLVDRMPSIDHGIFGWVLKHGQPSVFELGDERTGERVATVIYPLGEGNGRSIFVLDGVPLAGSGKDELLATVREIADQIESIVDLEEGVAVQELLAELRMRITDETEHIERLPVERRLRSFLDLALGIVAAESAIWVPAGGGIPVSTQPETLEAARLVAQAWEKLESLVDWVQEKGTAAEGMLASEFDPDAPRLAAPYVGVPGPDGDSALIVIFSPAERAAASAQLPPAVLWQVLNRVCELIPRREPATA